MGHLFVTSQHHHSSWHVHLLDCVMDFIQTYHNGQMDVSFQVVKGEQKKNNVYSSCLTIEYLILLCYEGKKSVQHEWIMCSRRSDTNVLSEEGLSPLNEGCFNADYIGQITADVMCAECRLHMTCL